MDQDARVPRIRPRKVPQALRTAQDHGVRPGAAAISLVAIWSARICIRRVAASVSAARGRVESFTSYSATGSTVATLAADTDAATRLRQILADQIATRLIAAAPGLTP